MKTFDEKTALVAGVLFERINVTEQPHKRAQSAFVPTRQNASATANNLPSMRAPGEAPNFDRLVYFVHTTSSFDTDLNFYSKVAGAKSSNANSIVLARSAELLK